MAKIILVVFLLSFFSAQKSVADEEGSAEPKAHARTSFVSHVFSGKYNLIEDDFADVPRRATRFDYMSESMEEFRYFSRPDASEFAILNLQWKDGAIFINDFKTVTGQVKQSRGAAAGGKDKFFYRLFSGGQQLVYESFFEVPQRLHFDYLAEENGELQGGSLLRNEADFVLKIPLLDKTADRILFYRQPDQERAKARKRFVLDEQDAHQEGHKIGETLF